MNFNLLFLIVIILMIYGIMHGWNNGLVDEVGSLINMVLSMIILGLFIAGVKAYLEHNISRTIIAIVCVLVAAIVYKVTATIIASLKFISKLPVIHSLNRLLGAGVGIAEAVVIIWIFHIIIIAFHLVTLENYLQNNISGNVILTFIFENNYLAKIIAGL